MITKTKAKAPKQCDKQRTQRPRQINHGQPDKPTVPSDSLGRDGEERPAAPNPKRARPRRRVGRRGSPPQAPKQARKQKNRDQTSPDTKARPPNQSNNQKTKRSREAQRPMQSNDGATGPTSICLFVLVCVVWVCSPKATETKARPPNPFNNQKHRDQDRPRDQETKTNPRHPAKLTDDVVEAHRD